jgi:mono/diheme cytochrome c family protein
MKSGAGTKTNLLVVVLLAVLLPACAFAQTPVERGRYLAVLGDCAGCHDTPHGAPYAGGQSFSAVFGRIYSSNLTPDRATGIGRWSAHDFYAALHRGARPDGVHLYPAFPYPYFTHLARADSDALFAFLKTQKPVRFAPPDNELRFPFNIRALMWFWNLFFLDATPLPAGQDAQWSRGNFLVNGPGHCAECHTPKNTLFGDKTSKAFGGEIVDNWFAANLTGAKPDGLGAWTAAEIAAYLKTGAGPHATAVGPMQDVVSHSTRLMRDADRAAIAAYLKSLPSQSAQAVPPPKDRMAAGEGVFLNHCLVCHQTNRRESLGGFPLLAHNTLVQGRNPATVLRVILGGSQSIGLPNTPMPYSMPAFATLSDDEIAAVATYIRNTWGNRAPAVDPGTVRDLRKAVR